MTKRSASSPRTIPKSKSPASAKQRRLDRLRGVQREAILEAAESIFARVGYHPAKMSDIAKQAGFSAGSLYTYFSGKEEMFLTLIKERFNEIHEQLVAQLQVEADFMTTIEGLVAYYTEFMDERRSFFSILFSEGPVPIKPAPAGVGNLVSETTDRFSKLVGTVIQRGIDEGVLREVNAREVGMLMLGVINSAIFLWLQDDPPRPFAERMPAVLDLFLNGVKR